jgi:two-component system chemotaxis sensor kinase CheA
LYYYLKDNQEETPESVSDEPINTQSPSEEISTLSDTIIRVDVQHLDKLMNLVGELVLTRNQILQLTSGQENTGLLGASQRLNLITSELQEGIMKTRMQPIKKLWDKFPRLVRDLSMAC